MGNVFVQKSGYYGSLRDIISRYPEPDRKLVSTKLREHLKLQLLQTYESRAVERGADILKYYTKLLIEETGNSERQIKNTHLFKERLMKMTEDLSVFLKSHLGSQTYNFEPFFKKCVGEIISTVQREGRKLRNNIDSEEFLILRVFATLFEHNLSPTERKLLQKNRSERNQERIRIDLNIARDLGRLVEQKQKQKVENKITKLIDEMKNTISSRNDELKLSYNKLRLDFDSFKQQLNVLPHKTIKQINLLLENILEIETKVKETIKDINEKLKRLYNSVCFNSSLNANFCNMLREKLTNRLSKELIIDSTTFKLSEKSQFSELLSRINQTKKQLENQYYYMRELPLGQRILDYFFSQSLTLATENS